MTIRAVLFDLHGVLTSSPWSALAEVGTGGGRDEAAVLELILGDYAADTDHPWHRLERGEIGLAEYAAAVSDLAREAGVELDWGRLQGFGARLTVNEEVVARIRELRRDGYRTALVTNNVREVASGWRALLPVDELFDAVVDSSAVGVRKPNPAIFEHALAALGVRAEEAVFLDDAPGNVAGAATAGLHTILVEDVRDAIAALDALLTSPPAPSED